MEHIIGLTTYFGSVIAALLAGMGAGFFVHIYDKISTRKGLAKMLYGELQINQTVLKTHARHGLISPAGITDVVYSGLLSSGNMRYLAKHQFPLHALYASMRRNDHGVMEEMARQMMALRASM